MYLPLLNVEIEPFRRAMFFADYTYREMRYRVVGGGGLGDKSEGRLERDREQFAGNLLAFVCTVA